MRINFISKINKYYSTDGTKYSSGQVEARIKKAKSEKLSQFLDNHGYFFCEVCGINGAVRIDCSHTESVRVSKNNRRVEMAWDVGNIKLRCRECHNQHDISN